MPDGTIGAFQKQQLVASVKSAATGLVFRLSRIAPIPTWTVQCLIVYCGIGSVVKNMMCFAFQEIWKQLAWFVL